MRLDLALFRACLSLFLALGAAAGVVRVPANVAGYQAGLVALDPVSAKTFLSDGPAKEWFKTSLPDMYASSLLRAHEIVQLQTLPAYHRAAFLRREIIAVESLPLLQNDSDLPAKHRAEYGAKVEAGLLAKASCEWDTLSPAIREGIVKQGLDATHWKNAPVSMRAALIAAWWHQKLFVEGSPVEPGTPEYLDRVRLYARRAGAYLTDMEATELSERIMALERVAKRLPELRAAAAGDDAALQMIEEAATLSGTDAVKASAWLDKRFGVALAKSGSRFVHDPRDQNQKKALTSLAKKLDAAFRRLTQGTTAEGLLAKAAGRIQVGGVPAGSDGAYQAYGDRLALPADVIDFLLRDRDARFEDLATDDGLVERLAVLYLPTYVHETTHRLQGRVALKKSLTAIEKGLLYGHEDEIEAYLAQELFIREFAKLRPELVAWARGIPRVEGLWDPKIIARQGKRVSRLYSDVPGGAGRRAQGLMMAISESNQALSLKPRIERELLRRRKSKSVNETRDPVRLTSMEGYSIKRAASRLLKRWRDIAGTNAALFADRILAYFDEGDARIRELKARLRLARRG